MPAAVIAVYGPPSRARPLCHIITSATPAYAWNATQMNATSATASAAVDAATTSAAALSSSLCDRDNSSVPTPPKISASAACTSTGMNTRA